MDTFILCAENSAMSLDSGAYEFYILKQSYVLAMID
jgi:hypothetical protein